MSELDRYVLDQAKIEIEHTRSWPYKISAFAVAVNAGVVTGIFARFAGNAVVPLWPRLLAAAFLVALLALVVVSLRRNHLSPVPEHAGDYEISGEA